MLSDFSVVAVIFFVHEKCGLTVNNCGFYMLSEDHAAYFEMTLTE